MIFFTTYFLTTEAQSLFTEVAEKNYYFSNAEALCFVGDHRGSHRVLHSVNSVKRSFSVSKNNKNSATSVKNLCASVVKISRFKNLLV